MSNVVIELPFPPSANALFRNATAKDNSRKRPQTQRYRTWIRAAGWDLERQRPPKMEGPVALDIAVGKPVNRDGTPNKVRRDIGNLHKAIEDLLVDHGVIEDDSLVHDLRIHWQPGIEGARVTIQRKDAA